MPNECLRVVVSAYMGDQTRRGGCRENIRQLISCWRGDECWATCGRREVWWTETKNPQKQWIKQVYRTSALGRWDSGMCRGDPVRGRSSLTLQGDGRRRGGRRWVGDDHRPGHTFRVPAPQANVFQKLRSTPNAQYMYLLYYHPQYPKVQNQSPVCSVLLFGGSFWRRKNRWMQG